MIEFKGELSKTCKDFVVKNEANCARRAAIIVCIPLAAFDIWWSVSNHLIYLIALPALVMAVFLAGIKSNEKGYGLIMTKRVMIENNYLECEGDQFHDIKSIDRVKSVIDYGEWYKFEFSLPGNSQRFICQKDLITQGTIEDFENLFADKIIRRG